PSMEAMHVSLAMVTGRSPGKMWAPTRLTRIISHGKSRMHQTTSWLNVFLGKQALASLVLKTNSLSINLRISPCSKPVECVVKYIFVIFRLKGFAGHEGCLMSSVADRSFLA